MSDLIPELLDIVRITYPKHEHYGKEGIVINVDEEEGMLTVQLDSGLVVDVSTDTYEYIGHGITGDKKPPMGARMPPLNKKEKK